MIGKYRFVIAIILIQLIGYNFADPISCIQCEGDACSGNVSDTPKACPDETNVIHDKCFTQIDSTGKITRGCLKTGDTDCKTENNCIATESGKNNQIICKTCDGTDENCSQSDMKKNDVKYNKICSDGVKKCITKLDNKLVVRGCATDHDVATCTDAKTCKACDTVNCNIGIFPTNRINCYQCSGSSCTDVTSNSLVSKPCLTYEETDQCYTKGESATDMSRGCKSDTKDNKCTAAGEGCAFCSTDNCNALTYQHDQKLLCHQCSSDDTTNDCFKEQTTQANAKNCEKKLLYNETEYCYTQLDGNKITRGCLHDNTNLTPESCKDDGTSETCNKCTSGNGCNSKAVSVTFTCIVCRSDLNEKCWNYAAPMTGKECRTSPSSAKEGCFHGIWNGVAIRGCMVDASVQNQEICRDKDNNQCHACYQKDCNKENSSGASKIGFQFGFMLIILTTLWSFK